MKKAKKAKLKKDDIKVALRYGISIPEKDLMKLLEFNCAKELKQLGIAFASDVPPECPSVKSSLLLAAKILGNIQDAWEEALKEFADATKLPKGVVPKGYKEAEPTKTKAILSNDEKGKIRALRKTGLSIKAIGKEIHRAEKVVRDFCKTLPF